MICNGEESSGRERLTVLCWVCVRKTLIQRKTATSHVPAAWTDIASPPLGAATREPYAGHTPECAQNTRVNKSTYTHPSTHPSISVSYHRDHPLAGVQQLGRQVSRSWSDFQHNVRRLDLRLGDDGLDHQRVFQNVLSFTLVKLQPSRSLRRRC